VISTQSPVITESLSGAVVLLRDWSQGQWESLQMTFRLLTHLASASTSFLSNYFVDRYRPIFS